MCSVILILALFYKGIYIISLSLFNTLSLALPPSSHSHSYSRSHPLSFSLSTFTLYCYQIHLLGFLMSSFSSALFLVWGRLIFYFFFVYFQVYVRVWFEFWKRIMLFLLLCFQACGIKHALYRLHLTEQGNWQQLKMMQVISTQWYLFL